MAMLASILDVSLMFAAWDEFASKGFWLCVARGDNMWYTREEGTTQEVVYTISLIIWTRQWRDDRFLVDEIKRSDLVAASDKAIQE